MTTKIQDKTQRVVQTLLAEPGWRNPKIAAAAGCERRCVQRYRKLIATRDITADLLDGLDAQSVWELFNERERRSSVEEPPFDRLHEQHPGTSIAERWRIYCNEQIGHGLPALSMSQFRKRLRAHEERRWLP